MSEPLRPSDRTRRARRRAPGRPFGPAVRGAAARRTAAVLAAAVLLPLAACQSPGDGGGDGGALVFWTPHVTPDRLAQQEATAAAFTEQSGVDVDVVPMSAEDQNQSMAVGSASGDVPDVVLLAPDQAAAWSAQGVLDTGTAAGIVEDLGPDTFGENALDMVTFDGTPAAVPSDGWGQVLVYRADLLADAGLDPPRTLEDVADAAEELDGDGRAGIALGTRPGDPFTTQTLEALLLAGGCDLVDGAGEVALESPECVDALDAYARMAEASVPGDQDVETTRAAYLSGEAAMLFWGSHIFDELAGLAPDFPPTCPECADDPDFLASESGTVGALTAPDGSPVQYGLTLNLGIPVGADAENARAFTEYLMGPGYVESLEVSPEGRVPVRPGTPDDPDVHAEAWSELPTGEDPENRAPLSDFYGDAVIGGIVEGAQSFRRWGYGTEHAAFAGPLAAQNTLAKQVGPLFEGEDPATVAASMADAARAVQADNE
ncbi:ABC transporter substrate-binding protein [Nocardiopsis baichengensis]|uniref:ABC transporter substrate-binding protein n=1 Tax=Nocardiopsis baichengensis TaxID=280240 RepID=UPI000347AD5B|nr:extracellular solute-binding protein [Nocardiopsis baichengensis]